MDKLIIPTLKSTVLGVVLLGLLLFLPAGTLNYWQAWAVIAIFVLGSNAIGIYLSVHDPELLERRKQAGPQAETRPAQKIIILILIAALVGMLVLSALDRADGLRFRRRCPWWGRCWPRSGFTSPSSWSRRTASALRRSGYSRTRRSFPPDPTPWCDIRCIRGHFSWRWRRRWRLASGGACCRFCSSYRCWFGGFSMRRNFSMPSCQATRITRARCGTVLCHLPGNANQLSRLDRGALYSVMGIPPLPLNRDIAPHLNAL